MGLYKCNSSCLLPVNWEGGCSCNFLQADPERKGSESQKQRRKGAWKTGLHLQGEHRSKSAQSRGRSRPSPGKTAESSKLQNNKCNREWLLVKTHQKIPHVGPSPWQRGHLAPFVPVDMVVFEPQGP